MWKTTLLLPSPFFLPSSGCSCNVLLNCSKFHFIGWSPGDCFANPTIFILPHSEQFPATFYHSESKIPFLFALWQNFQSYFDLSHLINALCLYIFFYLHNLSSQCFRLDYVWIAAVAGNGVFIYLIAIIDRKWVEKTNYTPCLLIGEKLRINLKNAD